MINDLCTAVLIVGPVILIIWAALRLRPRHRDAITVRDHHHQAAADQWAQAWRPDRSADILRLRRDLRPWLPHRRLP